MKKCCSCNKRIWFFQKIGFNSSWHKKCTVVWKKGYNCAMAFCKTENQLAGYKSAIKLYWERLGFNKKVEK